MSEQQIYTVIGVYESTGEIFDFTVREARDAYHAIEIAAENVEYDSDLTIIGAIPADVTVTAACEDSYKAASAADFEREDE